MATTIRYSIASVASYVHSLENRKRLQIPQSAESLFELAAAALVVANRRLKPELTDERHGTLELREAKLEQQARDLSCILLNAAECAERMLSDPGGDHHDRIVSSMHADEDRMPVFE